MTQPTIKQGALDSGTNADQVVVFDSFGNYPASDGNAISNVDASAVQGGII